MDGLPEGTATPGKHPGAAHGRRERSPGDPHLQTVPALAALTSWSPDHGAALPGLEGCAAVPALEAADLRCEGGQISEIVRDQQLALED
jgi:hypothetical protein